MTLTDVRMSASIPDINADIEVTILNFDITSFRFFKNNVFLTSFFFCQDMRILSEGINKKNSAACYVALLISNIGHSIPLICEFCWDYCNIFLSERKYSQVFHILQLIVPYFLNSIDALLKQEK